MLPVCIPCPHGHEHSTHLLPVLQHLALCGWTRLKVWAEVWHQLMETVLSAALVFCPEEQHSGSTNTLAQSVSWFTLYTLSSESVTCWPTFHSSCTCVCERDSMSHGLSVGFGTWCFPALPLNLCKLNESIFTVTLLEMSAMTLVKHVHCSVTC